MSTEEGNNICICISFSMEMLSWRLLQCKGGQSGSTLGTATVEGACGPFDDFSPMTKGFWQCKPMGRGVLQTHK